MRLAIALLIVTALLLPLVAAGCGSATGEGSGIGGLFDPDNGDPGIPGTGPTAPPGQGGGTTNPPGPPNPPTTPDPGTDPGGPPPPPTL
ncbi:MAG TPA: hypothetical protein QGH10_00730 [Armatimonadota bacterium]|jgi:hypothetical protein|nr:hypothetical protein [Armatimonadota bacterium]